jgi:hypothetical protein
VWGPESDNEPNRIVGLPDWLRTRSRPPSAFDVQRTLWALDRELRRYLATDIDGQILSILGFELGLHVERTNQMSRLRDKLTQAKNICAEVTATIEARADSLIAKRDGLNARTDQAFAPHEQLLNEAEAGLNEVEEALRVLSNGGPPLAGSDTALGASNPTKPQP